MPRQARAQVTRDAILHAAGVVFARLSYSTATLADVITEAGVTQGALYFHFDSKHHLAVELIRRQHEISQEADPGLADAGGRALHELVHLSGHLARLITSDPIVQGGLRLSTESSALFPEYAEKPYLDWIDLCTAYLRRAVAQGDVLSSIDLEVLSRFVMSAFTGVQVVSRALSSWSDLPHRLEEMWVVLLPAITVPGRRQDTVRWPESVRQPAPA